MDRVDVYKLIDEEREYQDSKPPRPKSDKETSIAEWLIYMEFFLSVAKECVYRLNEKDALEAIRKIAALSVACMENNDTPSRQVVLL